MKKDRPWLWRVGIPFLLGGVVGAASIVQVVPNYSGPQTSAASTRAADPGVSAVSADGTVPVGPVDEGDSLPLDSSGSTGSGDGVSTCAAGRNGGATDQGVTATEIKLASTVVESGIGRPFLRDVRFAMEAVRNEVNRTGGICGRRLSIQYVDDAWDAQRGAGYLRNFLQQKIFAIPVAPSSEGLRVVISSGDIDAAQIPVVGTDGMLKDQYVREDGKAQPWIWAVAAATVASARIMAQWANSNGKKNFGIVFDKNYRFGQEAALAFNSEVKRLTGKDVLGFNGANNCKGRYCGIQAGQPSYSNEAKEFADADPDFIALFLEPQTALTWMNDPQTKAAQFVTYGAAQPLFTRSFAENCQRKCDQMTVWTSFKPYIESYRKDPAVRKYVDDMKRASPQADYFNAFAEGGYVGMQLLVKALRLVGPNLTRARLKAVLDTVKLDTGLTIQPILAWKPGFRWVNTAMRGYTIQFKGSFAGWSEGPIVTDPRPGVGTS